MPRPSMGELIAHVRLLIGDPAGSEAVFTDDELQGFLDDAATDVFYAALEPEPSLDLTGAVRYLTWRAANGWWEATEELTDRARTPLTPIMSDRRRGRWRFSTEPDGVFIRGVHYDVYRAAYSAVLAWKAKLKLDYDFAADGGSFQRSQALAALDSLAESLLKQSSAGGIHLVRMERWDA